MKAIKSYDFLRHKYGRELLIDVADTSTLTGFGSTDFPYRFNFYELILIRSGRGATDVDDERYELGPKMAMGRAPGRVRRWRSTGPLDAVLVFFPEEFVSEFIADATFLQKLDFLRGGMWTLDGPTFERLDAVARRMATQVASPSAMSLELLRSGLYTLLVELEASYQENQGLRHRPRSSHLFNEFRRLVEEHFMERQRVSDYTRLLGVTAPRLAQTCMEVGGVTPGELIRSRIFLEAKRLLSHTDQQVASIAYDLGFCNPSHFGRFIKRRLGVTPAEFRRQLSKSAIGSEESAS